MGIGITLNLKSKRIRTRAEEIFPMFRSKKPLQMIHSCQAWVTHKAKAMMRILKPLQDKATTGAGKRLVLPEPRRVRFLIRGEGSVSAGAVTIECCPESTKAGKFWMELATIPVPDNGIAQYYTEEASGLFRARISQPVSNGAVTVTPLVSRGRPDRPDRTKVV